MNFFSDESLNALALKLHQYAIKQGEIEHIQYWKVLRRKAILSICRKKPLTVEELTTKQVLLGKHLRKKYGEDIIKIIREHYEMDDSIPTDNSVSTQTPSSTPNEQDTNSKNYTAKEKLLLIERSKMYLKSLCDCIHPVTGAEIPKDIIDEKVKRCFNFISGILDEYIEYSPIQISQESTTIISSPPIEHKARKNTPKRSYYLLPEHLAQFEYSDTPIPASEIMNRITAIGPQEGVKKFPRRKFYEWLISVALIEEVILPNGSKQKTPTDIGKEIGMSVIKRQGHAGEYCVTLFNLDAQHFIIDNIECILNFAEEEGNVSSSPARRPKEANQGLRWTPEQDQTLIQMFRRGDTVAEIAVALQRTHQGIRARLVKLKLIDNRSDAN